MEISKKKQPAWMDETHPNYLRWKRAREISTERGKFVVSIIERQKKCEELTILDLGSGQGGTANVLSEKNLVISLDLSITRILNQNEFGNKIFRVNGDALKVPLRNNSFDMVILQDVIEHVANPVKIIEEVHSLLKADGIIYLSTPNKFSFFNIITDPHWGLPFVSLLKRDSIRKYFLKYFRRTEFDRDDIAQLLSLSQLKKIFDNKFEIKLNTKFSVDQLLNGNRGIVWSDFHLGILDSLKTFRLNKLVKFFANDSAGFINNFFNPTFYFLLKKK